MSIFVIGAESGVRHGQRRLELPGEKLLDVIEIIIRSDPP